VLFVNLVVRNVDDVVFRKFKVKAVEEDLNLGHALNQAMIVWVNLAARRKKRAPLLDFKPFDFGKGSEHTSEQIDAIVYGGAK